MALKKWASGKLRGHREERKEQSRKTRRVEDKKAVENGFEQDLRNLTEDRKKWMGE